MPTHLKVLYEFGSFLLDPAERSLLQDGKPVPLTPKVFDLLLLLVESSGRLLEKEDLMRSLWQDSFVEEGNLSFNISTLRKALGEDPKNRRYIETIPKRGYRFIANVRRIEQELIDRPRERDLKPAIDTVPEKNAPQFFSKTEKNEIQKSGDGDSAAKNVPALSGEIREGIETNSAPGENARSGPPVAVAAAAAAASSPPRPEITTLALIGLAAAIAVAVAFGLYKFTREPAAAPMTQTSAQNTVSEPMKVTRLTTGRNITYAAISPDGKYVAYIIDEARKRSLWLRQITTNSDSQLIAPADVNYLDVVFSPDGNYIYYFKDEPKSTGVGLYQIPVLGGTSR